MAQEIPFKILVETLTAEKSVGELKQEFNDLNAVIEKTKVGTDEYKEATTRLAAVKEVLSGVASDVTGVANANKVLTTGLPALNKEYKDLQRTIQSGKLSADELQKALFRAGEVRGQIKDLNQQINALDPERRFAAFAKIGSTIASGFAAAQAATALFGNENEDLIKVLVKVQAATALAQGLQGLAGFQKALVAAGLAMKAFALSNPFTAILVGVTALTAGVIALANATKGQSAEVSKLNKEYEAQKKISSERITQIDAEIISLQGVAGAEEAILRLRREKVELTSKELQTSLLRQQAAYNEAQANNTLYESILKVVSGVLPGAELEFIKSKEKRLAELRAGINETKDLLLKSEAETTASATALQNQLHENKLKLLESEKNLIETSVTQQINVEREKLEVIRNSTTTTTEEKLIAEQEFIQRSSEIIETSIRESANKQIEIERIKNEEIQNSTVATAEVKQAAQNSYSAAVIKITETTEQKIFALRKQTFDEEITSLEAHKLQLQTINQSTATVEIEIENKKLEFLKNSGTATKAQIELAQATHAARMKEIYQKQVDDAIKAAEEIVNAEAKKWEDLKQFHEINQRVTIETVIQEAEESEDPIAIENAQYQERLLNLENFNTNVDALDVDAEAKKELKRKEAERLAAQHQNNLTNITKNAAEQRRQLELTIVSTGINTIGQLATAFAGKNEAAQRRAFNIQKAVGIAQATIDTYVAAQGAYKSQMAIPSPDAPVRAAVAAGLAVVQGLARVAIIARTEFNSSGAGSGAGGGASIGGGADFTPQPIAPPQFNNTGTNTDQDGNFTGFNRPQPIIIQNNIVESDFTPVQRRVADIEARATFGN